MGEQRISHGIQDASMAKKTHRAGEALFVMDFVSEIGLALLKKRGSRTASTFVAKRHSNDIRYPNHPCKASLQVLSLYSCWLKAQK